MLNLKADAVLSCSVIVYLKEFLLEIRKSMRLLLQSSIFAGDLTRLKFKVSIIVDVLLNNQDYRS